MDEPGAPAFPALAKAVAAVKKYAPGKVAYINLFPSYATVGAPDQSQLGTATYTEYLERFVNEVRPQIISYDIYMVQFRDAQGRDWAMLVNLSPERSINARLTTVKSYERIEAISAEDGRFLPLDEQHGHWLLAGHGLLIRFE